jgi:hypothetical protein
MMKSRRWTLADGRWWFAALLLAIGHWLSASGDAASGVARLLIQSPQRCEGGQCVQTEQGWGTAVVVGQLADGTWVSLSCAHNFEALPPASGAWLRIRGKWRAHVKVTRRAKTGVDLSLVGFTDPNELRYPPLAADDLQAGEWFEVAGFPGDSLQHQCYSGLAEGPTSGKANGPIVPGFSGGGIYNRAGELVGIQWGGTPDGDCHWTPISVVREILTDHGLLGVCQSAQPLPADHTPSCPAGCARCERLETSLREIEAQLGIVRTELAALRSTPDPPNSLATLRTELEGVRAELDRLGTVPTPIRVWRDDGTLAGESTTHLFAGEAIDLRFNPRAARASPPSTPED